MSATLEMTIGEMVTLRPSRARLFESLGLDYCCGGKKSLAAACAENKLDAPTVLRLIDAFDGQVPGGPGDENWANASLTQLADHIEQTHHAYLRAELPRLEQLVRHVAQRHGNRDPHLNELREIFLPFKAELEAHMAEEEAVVFPACRRLDDLARRSAADAFDASVAEMTHEHEAAGAALSRMREVTSGFTPPAGACNTYRVMYASLAELTEDMHRHVHKENSILFPRALAAEQKLKSQVD